ncbi:DBH-like monooxygenase protein 1 [Portunus trituberculatus]|uniref:DBH-like monooxygenase protein 1 n=1 Tax=Portunus trituberculatus TaxID=210409 RepID=A0A5B7EUJ5_PORTR|nr:DBH-like monooxygenase protein 1 [Portunus trituberculatus]
MEWAYAVGHVALPTLWRHSRWSRLMSLQAGSLPMPNMHYDFDYQNTRILKEEVTLLPGDSLVMECGYNASHRTTPTYGGFGTNEEMCLTFLSYYPRVDLFLCGSNPEMNTVLDSLGLEISAANKDKLIEMNWEAENKLLEKVKSGNLSTTGMPLIMADMLKTVNITAPQKYINQSLYNVLQDKAIWMDEGLTSALQKAVLEGNHTSTCHLHGQSILMGKSSTITAPDLQPLQDPLPEVSFMHSVVLDQQGSYVLLWTPRKEDVVFEVQVGTTGYVGLGFSPTGGMKGADIILGWVDTSGEVFLHDSYAEGNSAPMVDESQDVKLLGGYQNDTHTVLRFSRPWDTCDGDQDYTLSDDTVRVIWAYSSRDPASETNLHYHDRRGTKSLFLQSPQFEMPQMGADVKTWDFLSHNSSEITLLVRAEGAVPVTSCEGD